ncbi:epoxide hydrolase family protein [Microbacterium flavescens]|uniref:epoxide hydrolase family protein n=1 Tax=Microbacterium flavescens TaxID=69366 RepID=UPI001BDE2658|nr:epoxide hydrolase family protein [Microbacterium flavescens]
MNNSTALTPFRIDIPQSDLDDLHGRLARTRWPIPAPDRGDRADFSRGIPLPYLQELAEYWRDGFDWRAQEAQLNEHAQVTTIVDGQTFHVVHVRSGNPGATPLLLNHGWPGSFVEYQRLIPLLTDEFHLVGASPPGFGFSTPLSSSGWELAKTTDAYAEIMTRLGYERFAVHGSDIGSGIAGRLAAVYPQRVIGAHLGVDRAVLGLVGVRFPSPDGLTDDELDQLAALQGEGAAERGYLEMHNHRPDTIGPALTDSPVGLLAWIGEKFKVRSGGGGHRAPVVDRDQLLANISLYWFTRSGASSAQFYYEGEHTELEFAFAPEVPSAWVAFDTHPLIRRTMDPWNAVGHWTDHAEGGHFPAMEEPQLLANDIRDFFHSIS